MESNEETAVAESSEETAAAIVALLLFKRNKTNRKRSMWVKPWLGRSMVAEGCHSKNLLSSKIIFKY